MHKAHKLDLETGRLNVVFARNVAIALKRDPHAFDNSVFFSPVEGDPLTFAKRQKIASHFRRDTTWGLEHEAREYHEKLPGGEKTLLMQDNVFSYKRRALDFRAAALPGKNWEVREWIAAVGGRFLPVHVASVNETIIEAHKVRMNRTAAQFAQDCFVYFGGRVRPFANFFHDWNPQSPKFHEQQQRLLRFFEAFHTGEHGLHVRRDEDIEGAKPTRALDTPALFRAVATQTTIEEKGAHGLKVNSYRMKDSTLYTTIIPFNHADIETSAYQEFREGLVAGKHYWVQGMASVDYSTENAEQQVPPGTPSQFKNIRVVVNDFERQVVEVGLHGPG